MYKVDFLTLNSNLNPYPNTLILHNFSKNLNPLFSNQWRIMVIRNVTATLMQLLN